MRGNEAEQNGNHTATQTLVAVVGTKPFLLNPNQPSRAFFVRCWSVVIRSLAVWDHRPSLTVTHASKPRPILLASLLHLSFAAVYIVTLQRRNDDALACNDASDS